MLSGFSFEKSLCLGVFDIGAWPSSYHCNSVLFILSSSLQHGTLILQCRLGYLKAGKNTLQQNWPIVCCPCPGVQPDVPFPPHRTSSLAPQMAAGRGNCPSLEAWLQMLIASPSSCPAGQAVAEPAQKSGKWFVSLLKLPWALSLHSVCILWGLLL